MYNYSFNILIKMNTKIAIHRGTMLAFSQTTHYVYKVNRDKYYITHINYNYTYNFFKTISQHFLPISLGQIRNINFHTY